MKKMKRLLALLLTAVLFLSTAQLSLSATGFGFAADEAVKSEDSAALARRIAREGMILLKNENDVLPFKKSDKVAVFGRTQVDTVNGGTGSGYVYCPYVVNVLDGLENAGVNLDTELASLYRKWCAANPPAGANDIWGSGLRYHPEMPITKAQVQASKTRGSDKAVVVISRIPGENTDMGLGKGEYYLQASEETMIKYVTECFDEVILVLNIGSIIDMKFVEQYGIESVVYMNLAGQEGGNALADLLTSKETPSGKLTDTVAKNYSDYPSSSNFSGNNIQEYTEDIFVGYRYFETFDPKYEKVLYPFGFGLSYTTFSLSNAKMAVNGDKIDISVTVKNTGSTYSGKEVVQVYFSAPQMGTPQTGAGKNDPKLGKPGKELAAFAKTEKLAPGESQTLNLSFAISDMSSYDDTGVTGNKSCWVLEKGTYDVYLGTDIRDAGSRKIGSYTQTELAITERALTSLPTQLAKRLNADGSMEELEVTNPGGNDTPSGGFTVGPNEAVKIEAEAFSACGGQIKVETLGDVKYVTNYYVGETTDYTLNVTETGKYKISFRYANPYGTKSISELTSIGVDGGTEQVGLTLNFPTTGSAASFADSGTAELLLPKGPCTLKFTSKSDQFLNIDYFTLEYVDEGEKVTKISSTGQSKLEMENFSASSDQVRAEGFDNDGSGNPGYCLSWMHTPGNYASYKLQVVEGGIYNMTFRYSNYYGEIKLADMARIWVGNVEVLGLNVTFRNTGGYHNFVMANTVTINLPAGANVEFKVESKTSNFANLDYIIFEKANTKQTLSAASAASAPAASAPMASAPAASAPETAAKTGVIMLEDVYDDPSLMSAFLSQLTVQQLANLSTGTGGRIASINTNCVGGLAQYGIPGGQTADGPCGLRVDKQTGATSWPCASLIASSWDLALAEAFGDGLGAEAKAADVDFWLAPGLNIHRDPRGGRNFEYYSEDPYLAGKMAAAATKGVQGQNVGVTAKHYAVNSTEYNRLSSNSKVSERAMREIYLKNFEILIKEAQPWSIMSAYNEVNGMKICENYELMTVIPRQEWGYEGFFMTDWGNGSNHLKEVLAGNEVKMPSGSPNSLVAAVANGTLTRERLEENISYLLNSLMKTNVFLRTIQSSGIKHTVSAAAETKIKAVDHYRASSAISSEACQDTDGGQNPTYTREGEYLEYKIIVEKSGSCALQARIACAEAGAGFDVQVDGVKVASLRNVSSSGGWQSWVTKDVGIIPLSAGEHTLKIAITATGLNLNYLTLNPTQTDQSRDMNGDGHFTIKDVSRLLAHLDDSSCRIHANGDVNGDGTVSIPDVSTLLSLLASEPK